MTLPDRSLWIPVVLSLLAAFIVLFFREDMVVLVDLMGSQSGSPAAVALTVLIFFIGSLFLIPQWALIAAAVAAFGLVEGTAIAWFSTMVAATVHVVFARMLESRMRSRMRNRQLQNLRRLFRRNSLMSGFIVRFIPTGPAVFVNAAAGLFGVHIVGFLTGTAIGVVPKILLTAVVVSELISSAQGQQIGLWLGVSVVGLIAISLLSRRLAQRIKRKSEAESVK